MEVGTDDEHDVEALPDLVEGSEKNVMVTRVYGDDSGDVYEFLENRGIEAVVKPRRNVRMDTGPSARKLAVGRVRELARGVGCGNCVLCV